MATFYSKADAGAPAISYVASAYHRAGFDALKLILKACLVYGYGSKPAAGWELINEDTNFLVLRNGSHSGYVCLTMTVTANVTFYLAETYLGMSGDVMLGDGLKTGVAASNTIPQRMGLWCPAYSSAGSCWYVAADEKTFILQLAGGNGSPRDLTVSSTQLCNLLYVGEDSTGNFISVGGYNIASTSVGSAVDYFNHTGMTILKRPSTGFLIGSGSAAPETPSLYTGWQAADASILKLNTVPLCRPVWGEPSVAPGLVAGELRGLVQVPALMQKFASAAAQSLGFPTVMNTLNLNTPLDLGDGQLYVMAGAYANNSLGRLVTMNPEFW